VVGRDAGIGDGGGHGRDVVAPVQLDGRGRQIVGVSQGSWRRGPLH